MLDTSKPVENPELSQALEQLHRNNTPETQNKVLDLVVNHAYFLAPVVLAPASKTGTENVTQFQLISSQDGRAFFPAFTDWTQLRKLCGPRDQQTLVLSFDDYASLLAGEARAAGFVINPLDMPLTLERDFVAALAKQKQVQTGYSHQTIRKDTKVLFSEAKDCPQALLDQVRLAVAPLKDVQRLYLRLMTRPELHQSSYLIIVEHSGDQDTVFRTIAEAARPHLGNHYVDMVPFDSKFGKDAAKDAQPFFVRKV